MCAFRSVQFLSQHCSHIRLIYRLAYLEHIVRVFLRRQIHLRRARLPARATMWSTPAGLGHISCVLQDALFRRKRSRSPDSLCLGVLCDLSGDRFHERARRVENRPSLFGVVPQYVCPHTRCRDCLITLLFSGQLNAYIIRLSHQFIRSAVCSA